MSSTRKPTYTTTPEPRYKPHKKKTIFTFLKRHQNNIIIGVILLLIFFLLFPRLYEIGNNSDKVTLDKMPINYINILIKFIIVLSVMILIPLFFADSKDDFHFELTPQKYCDGGEYLYSSDPERKQFCSQFSKEDLARYSCGPGYGGGRPVWREGAGNQPPESDANWKNTRCDNISDSYEQQPL